LVFGQGKKLLLGPNAKNEALFLINSPLNTHDVWEESEKTG
jgi:hypothetical protein